MKENNTSICSTSDRSTINKAIRLYSQKMCTKCNVNTSACTYISVEKHYTWLVEKRCEITNNTKYTGLLNSANS